MLLFRRWRLWLGLYLSVGMSLSVGGASLMLFVRLLWRILLLLGGRTVVRFVRMLLWLLLLLLLISTEELGYRLE